MHLEDRSIKEMRIEEQSAVQFGIKKEKELKQKARKQDNQGTSFTGRWMMN